MLLAYTPYCCAGCIVFSLILWAFAGYAHYVNAKLPADDPRKKDLHPAAVHLVPILWPLLILFSVLIFIIRALLYGIYLILFVSALLIFRRLFFLVWLDRIATYVGGKLLEANTALIRLALGRPPKNPQAA